MKTRLLTTTKDFEAIAKYASESSIDGTIFTLEFSTEENITFLEVYAENESPEKLANTTLKFTELVIENISPSIFMRNAGVFSYAPMKYSIPEYLIESICKYCEDQAIYDKLSKYNDFYYKLRKLIK